MEPDGHPPLNSVPSPSLSRPSPGPLDRIASQRIAHRGAKQGRLELGGRYLYRQCKRDRVGEVAFGNIYKVLPYILYTKYTKYSQVFIICCYLYNSPKGKMRSY
jgi:hypothetical protein